MYTPTSVYVNGQGTAKKNGNYWNWVFRGFVECDWCVNGC